MYHVSMCTCSVIIVYVTIISSHPSVMYVCTHAPWWSFRGGMSLSENVTVVGNREYIYSKMKSEICHLLTQTHT